MGAKKVFSGMACIIMVTTLFAITMSAYPAGWGDDIRLTYADGNSICPAAAIDSNDHIYVVWQDERDGDYNIYLKKSTDSGISWSSDDKITDTMDQSAWPRISIDSNDVLHLLWLEETESNSYWQPYDNDFKRILYKSSADGGTTWSSEVQIASYSAPTQGPTSLDIAVGKDDVIHVAYSKYPPSNIYYRNSTDSGNTWSIPKVIGNDRDCARITRIAADRKGHIYVTFDAWGDSEDWGDIQFVKSDDNGNAWSSERSLIGGPGWANHAHLTAMDDGHVFAVFADNLGVGTDTWNDPQEIYIMISQDFAQSWDPRIRLTFDNNKSSFPAIALDSQNNTHIVWYDDRDGNWEIYYTKTDSNGNTLIDDTRLTDDPATSGFPVIAVDSNNTCHVFWHDNRVMVGNYEIYYKGEGSFPPNADAGPDQTVFISDEVQFNGSNSYDPDGMIVTYEWDFDASDGLWWETGAPPDGFGTTPTHIYDINGIYTVTLRVTDNNGSSDTDACEITVLVPQPMPPILYINVSQDGKDAILDWDMLSILGIDHYLIYRSKSQTDFDFSIVWKNTSADKEPGESSPISLRTIWNDTNAAFPGNETNYEEQYYYVIRAVNVLGKVSGTSRTVGKWTTTFSEGVLTFSLPLEPLETMNKSVDYYLNDMSAKYIKWMHPVSHKWMKHGNGGVNDTQMKLGEGYEVKFDSQSTYTFTGMPGAMISYDDDNGFSGFDPATEARNLTVSIEPDGNVTLNWEEPNSMGVGDWYEVYYSNERDGFFKTPGIDYSSICPPVYFGNYTATHQGAKANDPGARLYYMVVSFNASGVRGASTYSIGIWTEEYLLKYDTIGIPLKLGSNQTADWYCDNINNTVGINYFNCSAQRWSWHYTRMPGGAYDPILRMTEGYQISTSQATKYTFIGV